MTRTTALYFSLAFGKPPGFQFQMSQGWQFSATKDSGLVTRQRSTWFALHLFNRCRFCSRSRADSARHHSSDFSSSSITKSRCQLAAKALSRSRSYSPSTFQILYSDLFRIIGLSPGQPIFVQPHFTYISSWIGVKSGSNLWAFCRVIFFSDAVETELKRF